MISKRLKLHQAALADKTEVLVRFSDVDMMRVAWHGSYVAYLEDGREHFGKTFKGVGYDDYFRTGYVAPVVNLTIDYKQSLKCGDVAVVETRYLPTEGAKLILEYVIYRKSDMAVMATAQTTQMFMTADGEVQYTDPDFFVEWKRRWLKN